MGSSEAEGSMPTGSKGAAAAVAVAGSLLASCLGSPAGDGCQRHGLHIVDCGPCTSWVNVIEARGLQGEQMGQAARATLKVGARVEVWAVREDVRPTSCSGAGPGAEPQWSSTNPAVLRLEATLRIAGQPAALFAAVAPGAATVVASGLSTPSGPLESVTLTMCTSGSSLTCPYRVPLEIAVVP